MALKVLTENTTKPMKCGLEWNGEYGFEVKDSWGNTFVVNLGNQTCTCRSWMLKGIPCCHVIVALHFRKLEPINYVAHWYSKETYLKIYSHYIQPATNMEMWPQSTNPYVMPHVIRTLPGRPKKCRRKEQNENKTRKLSKRVVEMTYSLCHAKGHNKRGCHLNNQTNASATRRGKGTATGNGTGIGATRRGRGTGTGLVRKGRGTGVVVTATNVPGATRGGKRLRMIGM
ncbi:hypothetical protein H5410_042857 [Solanum commersonii]|uniref:SWIM-type domain-containing protein n=1 Tax=Solanum commersonii TaxID=4109 RepID=A0A9J5XXJ4_SOLCO|nr:hypothetical protein H5410_042857 [Solanum commersonii]